MKDQDLDITDRAYQQLVSAFERASRSTAAAHSLTLDIAGYYVLVRSTSHQLHERLRRPLTHLNATPVAPFPNFTIDFIDGTGEDEALFAMPLQAQRNSPEQETQELHVGPYLFTLHGDSVLTVFNEPARRTVGIVRDPEHWPLEHYQQALFISLYQYLIGRGFYLIHASAIGRNGKALLFSGKSGAGKTTTMLACVQAGFDFYSDDATLLRRCEDGQFEVISLLGTLNVTETTLDWFPELVPHATGAASRTGKRVVMIHEVYPRRMAAIGRVHGLIAPEISTRSGSDLAPIGKMNLLSELLPFSLDLHDDTVTRDHLDFLLDVLHRVPSYRLNLGPMRNELPPLLEQVLTTAAGSPV